MPPSKTGWPSLNVVIFPPAMRLVQDDPKTVTTPEIIYQIHELILGDRRIAAKSRAEQLGISRERVGSIIHEDLDMRKLTAKWVPKCPNADQKRQCLSSEQLLEFFRRDPNDFLSQLVSMDETSSHHYDQGTKQHSMEWQHSGSPRPKNFECKNPLEKFSPQFWGDQDGILLTDYLPKGQTINAEYSDTSANEDNSFRNNIR